MIKILKDNFISSLLGHQCYTINKFTNYDLLKKKINNLKKPFFLTVKQEKKIKKLEEKKIGISFISKIIIFKKKFKYIENNSSSNKCRMFKLKDKVQLRTISLENTSNSRFVIDNKFPIKFRNYFRYFWLRNFFKKKRGDFLIVCLYKKKIAGFLLLIKRNSNYQIDLIVVKKNKQNKGVGHSLIAYVNDNFMNKKNADLIAGTQENNLSAINFYKKNGFKKVKAQYNHHIHA